MTTQIFRVYIQASPEAIFEAITSPDWSERYGYHARNEFELVPGGKYVGRVPKEMVAMGAPDPMVKGEVLECDPPKRFVHTFHAQFNPETVAEPGVIVTYLLEPDDHGLTRLTVHNEENNSPITMAFLAGLDATLGEGGGGYPFILSDLKTLLESGKSFQD